MTIFLPVRVLVSNKGWLLAAMTQSILIRSDEKRQKSKRRSRRGRRGFYSSDELIKLWSNKKSQECPPLPAIVMKVHEVHEKGDQLKEKVIFPIQKEKDELPQEVIPRNEHGWKWTVGLWIPKCGTYSGSINFYTGPSTFGGFDRSLSSRLRN